MMTLRAAVVLSVSAIAILTQACTLASPTTVKYEPAEDTEETEAAATGGSSSGGSSSGGAAAGGGAVTCSAGGWAKPDISKLTACAGGKGHCYPKNKVPGGEGNIPCEKAGEVCVADTVLKAGGGKLKSCKVAVLSNKPGACQVLATIPEADRKRAEANLKQDACDAGEVCAPCLNPENNDAPTGLCEEIGVKEAECTSTGGDTKGTTTAAPAEKVGCCTTNGKSAGVCMGSSTPGDLPQDSCSTGQKCAPKAQVEGTPVKCKSRGIAAGVCLDKCFNSLLGVAGAIFGGDGCTDTESCIPCQILSKMAPDGTAVPGCE